jgi:uncharacterized membrane protein
MNNGLTAARRAQRIETKHNTRWLTLCGLFMAINIGLSSFGLPVPGGHLYLNDIVIVAAALILDPLGAFLVGGVGAFLGDFFFYPLPMFVSLATHGIQAMAISHLVHNYQGEHKMRRVIFAVLVGAVIMVVGYSLGRAYVYSTPAYAWIKLPYEILQALFGVICGPFLVWKWKLDDLARRMIDGDY